MKPYHYLLLLSLLVCACSANSPNIEKDETNSSEYFEHILKNGDSCGSIAIEYNVPIVLLIEHNELSSNCDLSPGSIIKIPLIPTHASDSESRPIIDCAAVWHTVNEEESLLDISLQYGVHTEIIKNWNGKTKDTVVTDERLLIPLCPEEDYLWFTPSP